ncbi:MAG TPA: glycosyltransferase family 39 protein [Patescibacteria group bacterium]
MKRIFKLLGILLGLVVIVNFFWIVYKNASVISTPVSIQSLQSLYNNSQYAQDPNNRKLWLDDPKLYTIAGYNYVKGTSPGKMNIEHPPFVKYLFGISTLAFGNPSIVQVVFAFGSIITLIFLTFKLTNNLFLSNFAGLLLVRDELFQQQVAIPMLDIGGLFFVLLSILLFEKSVKNPKLLLLFGIVQGLAVGSKTGIFILPLVFLLYGVFFERKLLKNIIFATLITFLTYLLLYFKVFLESGITGFVDLNIDVVRLYRSYLPEYPWGEIWRLLITGNWRVWFWETEFVKVPEWSLIWPIGAVALFFSTLYLIKKKNLILFSILVWSWLYLISSSTHVIFPRHLLLFLPFSYMLIVYCLNLLILRIK